MSRLNTGVHLLQLVLSKVKNQGYEYLGPISACYSISESRDSFFYFPYIHWLMRSDSCVEIEIVSFMEHYVNPCKCELVCIPCKLDFVPPVNELETSTESMSARINRFSQPDSPIKHPPTSCRAISRLRRPIRQTISPSYYWILVWIQITVSFLIEIMKCFCVASSVDLMFVFYCYSG